MQPVYRPHLCLASGYKFRLEQPSMDWEHPSRRLDLAFISIKKNMLCPCTLTRKDQKTKTFQPSDSWTSNDRAGRGQQSNLTSCLFHQIFSNHLLPLSIRFMDQQWTCWTRPAEQLDIMPFPSDFFKSLASLVHQIHGPAMIVLDEASRATWHHAFSIRCFQITCFPCPSDSWTSNDRAGRGRQSNLTSCLFHQIFSIHLLPLSIRFMDQQWSCWTRPAEQLDIMPFPSDFFKSLAALVHQIHGPAMIVLDEASRATWHHAFSIRFFQITCFPCPSDSWTSNDRAGRGQQSNLTSCLFHQMFSNHLLPLSIRFMDQQWSCWTRPAEQLDIMPFPSDFFNSLASLVHQIHGPAMIVLDEASRATWHHAFSIRFFQITCFPCPSDSWTSNERAGRGQQSNLTSCLFHQIVLNHLLPLSIRFMDQQWSCWRRPAEQLDIMPFPSDFFNSLASLVHQIHGPAMIVLDEASRATWHHAFSIRFFQITCFPCPSDSWTSNDRAGRGQQSNLTSCLFHQIFSIHLLPLSIRFMDQQWSCWTRPAEQLDIMPFPSDFFKSLASLVHQIHGPAMIVLDEASRATWHHAFSIRFFQITCFPCPSDSWTSNDRAGRGQQSNLTSCLFHQIFSNHLLPLSIRFLQMICEAGATSVRIKVAWLHVQTCWVVETRIYILHDFTSLTFM